MKERKGRVTMRGNSITLLGEEVKVGEPAPNFQALDGSLKKVELNDFKGKKVLISVVPSIDTGVCALQTKRFNEEASKLTETVFITISTDLPFAQKRFCDAEKLNTMIMLCDSVWHDFGQKYGVLIKDLGLLTRSIFVIDRDGKIAYIQIVDEISQHPDYDSALKAVSGL